MCIGDLRKKMAEMNLSPEQLAMMVPISNMTIRRWLQKKDKDPIPQKYIPHLQAFAIGKAYAYKYQDGLDITNVESLASHLMDLSKEQSSLKDLQKDLDGKLDSKKFDTNFLSLIKELKKWALQKDNITVSLIAIGALIYFINPIDVVPDYLVPIGYIDDLGVMSLALIKIKSLTRK